MTGRQGGDQPPPATERAQADSLQRAANNFARQFDAIATEHGLDLPMPLVAELVSLFGLAMSLPLLPDTEREPAKAKPSRCPNCLTAMDFDNEAGAWWCLTCSKHRDWIALPPLAPLPSEERVTELAEQLCRVMVDDDMFCWNDGGREKVEAILAAALR